MEQDASNDGGNGTNTAGILNATEQCLVLDIFLRIKDYPPMH